MYTLTYRHHYGCDTSLYATLELAMRAAAAIMVEWCQDHHGDEELAKLLNTGDYNEALHYWHCLPIDVHDEGIYIDEVSPISEVAMPPIIKPS